jgi:hypothetical protein
MWLSPALPLPLRSTNTIAKLRLTMNVTSPPGKDHGELSTRNEAYCLQQSPACITNILFQNCLIINPLTPSDLQRRRAVSPFKIKIIVYSDVVRGAES